MLFERLEGLGDNQMGLLYKSERGKAKSSCIINMTEVSPVLILQ